MKIDFVLTAGNMNDHYLQLFPLIHQVWKKRFNLDCYLILISDTIPNYLEKLKDFIIKFKPIDGIHTTYIAQVIRLLYPCLYPDKTILISDLDIIPVKREYFLDPIKFFHNNTFVTYTDRYKKQCMYAICYNVGKGSVYGDMLELENSERNVEGIVKKLKEWYNEDYDGKKNCPGWYTDQKKLFIYFEKFTGKKEILKDKIIGYKRLHNRARDKEHIIKNFTKIMDELESYSDIHCIKPFSRTKGILNKMVKKLTS